MNSKNIRCLVQNYFIDTEGNVLSDKISDEYFDGKKSIKLSGEQLEWAKEAADDTVNMGDLTYEEFVEKYNGKKSLADNFLRSFVLCSGLKEQKLKIFR